MLGEQKPPAPQSASTRQFPPSQVFAAVSVLDERHIQTLLPGQSESLPHPS
jgi:hypothetical protein